jgi:hypothetical protein
MKLVSYRTLLNPIIIVAFLTIPSHLISSQISAEIDHSTTFDQLPADLYEVWEVYYDPSTDWYRSNYNFAKYNGYQDLFTKFNGHLPSGEGIVVLQAESYHSPDAIGDVKHLFDYEASFKKDARINIRLSSKDLPAILSRALKEGMPYQTLVSSVLHKFVNGQFIDKGM